MAKKKGTKNVNNDSVELDQPQQQAQTAADRGEDAQQGQHETPVEDLDVDQLRQELQKARSEIARLKAELDSASCDRDTPLKGSKPQEVQDLQQKLQVCTAVQQHGRSKVSAKL